jgi:hypothetical protein
MQVKHKRRGLSPSFSHGLGLFQISAHICRGVHTFWTKSPQGYTILFFIGFLCTFFENSADGPI